MRCVMFWRLSLILGVSRAISETLTISVGGFAEGLKIWDPMIKCKPFETRLNMFDAFHRR